MNGLADLLRERDDPAATVMLGLMIILAPLLLPVYLLLFAAWLVGSAVQNVCGWFGGDS